ncbi:hypothetical protein [Nonomuraea jabiensis]|uniref:hypothetical protein n=1 Tax=Nonomuraea jabiensis TaxID=882448 RepID=UPI00367413A9
MCSPARALIGAGTVAFVLGLSACGSGSVSAADICGKARPLRLQVANTDAATYGAHADEWHQLIDMAKQADDPDLAKFAELVDEKSRNVANYYIPLAQIERTSCDGDKPEDREAG